MFFRFADPHYLLLLAVIPLLLLWHGRRQAKRRASLRFSHLGVIKDNISERLDQFLSVFKDRDEKILEFLSSSRSMEDFVEEALIYQKYPFATTILRFFEAEMISKHLKRLMSKGLVKKKDERFLRV